MRLPNLLAGTSCHSLQSQPKLFPLLLIQVINVTKDELRAQLERQEQRYKEVYGGEVTTYAAQPEPERKPWRKRASILDQAFQEEIQKIEKDLQQNNA
jgi:hypothetical protein